MGNILREKELYIALSDLFIDNEVNYKNIASVAKLFPVEHVKNVLFNYVAPACYYNTTTPVPPICYFFDADELMHDINKIKKDENSFFGRMKMYFFSKYLQLKFNHEWKTLKNLL
ncbi:hypothetical protein RHO13_03965 [Orbus wheelerorum]|uniref:DUF7079 family protein n=1 Tax=Orbus wheelerorum TaxID=3074111 RepID=UPI00370D7776